MTVSKKEFQVDDYVRWCPGCGNFSILSAVHHTLTTLEVKKEDIVFVSGIGCSSRFPYYVNTYGFHGIHGRAGAIATGLKTVNPKLQVWQITGDGDCLAIGGNHFIHVLRRNIDINIILMNNKIYGLTKGQYSPTTEKGTKTKTSPHGTIEAPFHTGELALGAQATFFARVYDTNPTLMKQVFLAGAKHKGASLTEVLQNCVIFADEVHQPIVGKEVREEHTIVLEHGKPMLFGKEQQQGLILEGLQLKAVTIGEDGITLNDILVHDTTTLDNTLHTLLAKMGGDTLPVAMGVIRAVALPTYEEHVSDQILQAKASEKIKSVSDLLLSGNTFQL